MAAQPPLSSEGQQALGLAWTIPVMLAVYLGLGYWLGGLLGSHVIGLVVGWVAGMGGVFYEIRRLKRNEEARTASRPSGKNGA